MDKICHSGFFICLILVFFLIFITSDVFPQQKDLQISEVKKLVEAGKTHYEKGEYTKALIKFHEAKDLIKGMPEEQLKFISLEIDELNFNLALTYFAAENTERNRERAREYLQLWLEGNPERTIEEIYYPLGFIEIFHQIKAELLKLKEKEQQPAEKQDAKKEKTVPLKEKPKEKKLQPPAAKPVVKKKAAPVRKPAKKKKTPWLIIVGLLAGGGAAAAILLLGGGPETGTIEINSTPSGARVYHNSTDTGLITNCRLTDVETGSHSIKLVKEGYEDYQQSVTVTERQTEVINADLTANTINVSAPTGGSVWMAEDEMEIRWNTGGGNHTSLRIVTEQSSAFNQITPDPIEYHSLRRMIKDVRFLKTKTRTETMSHVISREQDISSQTQNYSVFPSKPMSTSRGIETIHAPHLNRLMMVISNPGRLKIGNIWENEETAVHPQKNRDHSLKIPGLDNIQAISSVKIDLYKAGSWEKNISSGTSNDGSHVWTVSENISPAKNYKVRVSCEGEDGIFGESAEFEITNLLNTIDWIEVPAGWFAMGDNLEEGEPGERPVHDVYLNGYYISKYEVTFEQYDIFCDDTGRSKPGDNGWGREKRPVINISWHDAKAYCDWLSNKTGEDIHLPTEAQWEKAARGTDQRRYPWGNLDTNCNKANYSGCIGKTSLVGTHSAGSSAYGVHDMAGNVWEWCKDWYDGEFYNYSPSHNPQGPSSGMYRVFRGGSWNRNSNYLRSSYRTGDHPNYKSTDVGFRLCREK
ncbi:MAG: SUMF1/EgtB/PvdO family nonheme iron enzyme [Candidatus Aminicenantes bacterium]|nr:SUMF1/EgtB/PvdO family nonheme iron enzyme [Candidatus Aminicenantes bacterium]